MPLSAWCSARKICSSCALASTSWSSFSALRGPHQSPFPQLIAVLVFGFWITRCSNKVQALSFCEKNPGISRTPLTSPAREFSRPSSEWRSLGEGVRGGFVCSVGGLRARVRQRSISEKVRLPGFLSPWAYQLSFSARQKFFLYSVICSRNRPNPTPLGE